MNGPHFPKIVAWGSGNIPDFYGWRFSPQLSFEQVFELISRSLGNQILHQVHLIDLGSHTVALVNITPVHHAMRSAAHSAVGVCYYYPPEAPPQQHPFIFIDFLHLPPFYYASPTSGG